MTRGDSGFPVDHATLCATAIGVTCMEADALATVLMVMPPEPALRQANGSGMLTGRAGTRYRLAPSAAWRAE